MPIRKWQSSSGASKNRILGATRLKSEGQTIFPVTLNDNSSNAFALNVQGSNLVLGIGTSDPFSRLSMGNNTDSGVFNTNDTGRLASLALNETTSGGKFSGLFYNSSIPKYYQPTPTDISTNGIQIKTTSLNNFQTYESTGGNIFLTNENITTIGGLPRKGIVELDSDDYKGIEKYRTNQQTGQIFGDEPNDLTKTNREGQSKIVLDVRGSLRTDGYINFFNTSTSTDGDNFINSSSPSGNWWSTAGPNIPKGSVWLQPTGGGRAEGLWFKTSNGDIRRVEAVVEDAGNAVEQEIMQLGVFNFMFQTGDDVAATAGSSNGSPCIYPYVILKGNGAGRVQGDSGEVGGTAFNIRGIPQTLSDIKHAKGYNTIAENQKEIFSITQGSMSVTGLSGEEFLIQQLSADTIAHPMQSFALQNNLLSTDNLGGKAWIERQLLIGSKKSDLNWGLIDVQTTPNVPTLLSYNLDKSWDYSNQTNRINRRFITQKATNSIILLNKTQITKGYGGNGGSIVGSLYDCSNSIIIGDTFWKLDVPKSLIINVNPQLIVSGNGSPSIGQQVFDDIGGSIVSGKNNWVYKSPYSLVIGENNFIDNNQPGSYNATGLNSVLGDNNELWTATTNFVAGSYHKVSGGSNFVGGAVNLIGDFTGKTKERNAITSPTGANGSQIHYWNTVFGYYNKIHNNSGVNYSFVAGNANLVSVSRGVALGTHAYAGGDIRFAIGVNDSITTTTASSDSNSNKFVIDKDGNVGIDTPSPQSKLHIHNQTAGTATATPSADLAKLKLGYTANGITWYHELYCGPLPDPNIFVINAKGNVNAYGQISLRTNDIERMNISASGNVGIGVTAPKSALHIDAAIFAMGSTAPTKGIHLGMNSNTAIINLTANTADFSTIQFSNTTDSNFKGRIQYHHSQNRMGFWVNNSTESLRLETNGDIYAQHNVGIGTDSPDAKLQVNGDFHIQSTSEGWSQTTGKGLYLRFYETGGGGGYIQSIDRSNNDAHENLKYHAKNHYFNTPDTRLTILESGNVGIGTTSPKSKLDVEGDTLIQGDIHIGTVPTFTPQAARWLYFDNIDQFGNFFGWNGATTIGGIIFRGNAPSDYTVGTLPNFENYCKIDADAATGGGYGTLRGDIKFWTRNSGGGGGDGSGMFERMRIRYDGNVGIGTSTPGAKLEVSKEDHLRVCIVSRNNDGLIQNAKSAGLWLGATYKITGGKKAAIIASPLGPNAWTAANLVKLHFCVNNEQATSSTHANLDTDATISDSRMVIQPDGNVGIGTSSPKSILNIYAANPELIIQDTETNSNNANASLIFAESGSSGVVEHNYRIRYNHRDLIFSEGDYPNNTTEVMRFYETSSGGAINVGIGTSSPGQKLSVNGSIMLKGSSNSTTTNNSKIIFSRDITDTDESEFIARIYTGNYSGPLILDAGRGGGAVKTIGNQAGTLPVFSCEKVGDGELFRVCGGGNVGIGTTSPHKKLVIFGSDATLRIDSTWSGNKTTRFQMVQSGTTTISASNPIMGLEIQYDSNITPARTYFGHYNGSTTFNKHMTIYRTNGNVGIGVTDPDEKLEVAGNILLSGNIHRTAHNNGCLVGSQNRVGDNSSKTNPIYCIGSSYLPSADSLQVMYGIGYTYYNAPFIGVGTNGNWGMYVAAAGIAGVFLSGRSDGYSYIGTSSSSRLGIGTSSPTQTLDVNGTMRVTGTITATTFSGNLAGNVTGYILTPSQPYITSVGTLTSLNISGRIQRTTTNSGFLCGVSGDQNTKPIFCMSSGFMPNATNLSNMYGIGYANGSSVSWVGGNGGGYGMYVAAGGGVKWWLGAYNSYFTGGNFGIGTTSPVYKLDVVGTAKIHSTLTTAGIVASGNIARANHNLGCLQGSYNNVGNNDSKPNPIYCIGSSYLPTSTALSNMYGIGFCSGGAASFISGSANGWGMYVASDGDARVFLSGGSGNNSYIGTTSSCRLGIGTTNPSYQLDVNGGIRAINNWLRTTGNHGWHNDSHGRGIYFTDNKWLRCWGIFAFYNHSGVSLGWSGRYMSEATSYGYHSGSSTVGIECAQAIVADWFGANSDRRIKKNIEDIDDGDALKILREIPVRYYNYKDDVRKGTQKVAGFIAQEVKEIFPMAVATSPYDKAIPNILKKITNEVWEEITDSSKNKWLLKKFDLIDSSGVILPADISGGKSYKFEMQDVFDEEGEDKVFLSDSDGNFIFEKKWKHLFLYGICIDDFLTVDKNKIFAINFSASQEIDRIQQAEKIKVEELEKENSELKTEIEILKTQMSAILARLNTAGI